MDTSSELSGEHTYFTKDMEEQDDYEPSDDENEERIIS